MAPGSWWTGFGHEVLRGQKPVLITRRYRAELEAPESAVAVEHLRTLADHGPLTLLTATKDPGISAAAVLCALIADSPQEP
jgi:uncharacterized protein YeaO (DUF488 family)